MLSRRRLTKIQATAKPVCSTARHTDRYQCRQPGAVTGVECVPSNLVQQAQPVGLITHTACVWPSLSWRPQRDVPMGQRPRINEELLGSLFVLSVETQLRIPHTGSETLGVRACSIVADRNVAQLLDIAHNLAFHGGENEPLSLKILIRHSVRLQTNTVARGPSCVSTSSRDKPVWLDHYVHGTDHAPHGQQDKPGASCSHCRSTS